MGWEDLPPEVPTWKHMPATSEALALVISHEGHIAKLEAQLKREQKSVNKLSLANQELHERIKMLEDALRSMLEVCKDPKSYDFVKVSEIISKTLKVKS